MAQDLLTTYKYGWKTSYYQNTYDNKTDEVEPAHALGARNTHQMLVFRDRPN